MTVEHVQLGTGPPKRGELQSFYPPKFTWWQLKLFINSGDLGLLKRDKKLQERYREWSLRIKEEYGSIVDYLLNYRLQWGRPDRLSLLPSQLDYVEIPLCELPEDAPIPEYFTADTPSSLISIIQNDWPYSVPLEVEHSVIWTKIPILPRPSLIMPHIAANLPYDLQQKLTARLAQDGLRGFTGSVDPPPSVSLLADNLGALSDWGITIDKLIISPKGTLEEEEAVRQSSLEVQRFVARRWIEREWETAWFVNPPRLQSVKGLAHIHVFARKKNPEEVAAWNALDN
ncbi:uncharacterized protein FOMMEDRAFT_95368 [Fomitiporia mediterranea MF3/22]|uniref:uncharacterized protein n=1 Tax=Fomitiporia mediterranea (strain MF3/22) TaxID=694068 RepID=UPI0004408875|nr:uncharacterized protein FOMMEDRAFT_95368 [Fomitiporia mediterranea MF3/22]EJC98832.1 hypothetical protein FOMMEDRAFT_95368 [Fomitiporia mediterranea MF3/22]